MISISVAELKKSDIHKGYMFIGYLGSVCFVRMMSTYFFLGSFANFRLVTLMTLSAILSCHFASRVHTKGHDKSRGSRRQNATLELFDFTFCLQIQHHVYIKRRSLSASSLTPTKKQFGN